MIPRWSARWRVGTRLLLERLDRGAVVPGTAWTGDVTAPGETAGTRPADASGLEESIGTEPAADPESGLGDEVAVQVERSARETERLVEREASGRSDHPDANRPGAPINRRSPFYLGFMAVLGGLLAYGLVHLVLQLTQLLTLVALSLFLALGLEPVVARLVRLGLGRAKAVLVVFMGLMAALVLLGLLIVPTVVNEVTQLVERAPDYLLQVQHTKLVEDLNSRWHVTNRVRQSVQDFVSHVTFASLFGGILGAGKAIVSYAVAAFTVLILTLYFLAAMPRVKTAVYQLVPSSRRTRVVSLSEEITRRVGGYFLGQLSIATINGALSYAILKVLGLPFAAVLAVMVGVLALVPIIGTLIGGVMVTLVALASSWVEAIIVLGYYIAYHLLEAYLLGPRIMRRAVEVPAVVTIVAILAGETLLGVLGALIAIPVAAGLLLIYEQVIVPRQQRV